VPNIKEEYVLDLLPFWLCKIQPFNTFTFYGDEPENGFTLAPKPVAKLLL
jgi:hypothetical protein